MVCIDIQCTITAVVYMDIPVLPWYTWIYHFCCGIHGYTSTTMVYMDTLYPCRHKSVQNMVYRYTITAVVYMDIPILPWYTWIHCIHAGINQYRTWYTDIPLLLWYTWIYQYYQWYTLYMYMYMDMLYPCRHKSVQNMVYINIPLLLWYTWIYQYYHDIHGYTVSMQA